MDQYPRIDPDTVLWDLPTQKINLYIDRFKIDPIETVNDDNYDSDFSDSLSYMLDALLSKPIFQPKYLNFKVSHWVSPILQLKQYRFPKSKKKRIRIKWQKKASNSKFKEVSQVVFDRDNMTVFSDKKTIDKLNNYHDGLLRR